MSKPRLFLVDATAFCYRAFYAIRSLSTSFGQPTGAVYGFTNILNKILKDEHPDFFAVCFDVSRQTFRQKKFADYKAQRPPMPDELASQIPLIKEVTRACGISLFEKEGFEADDVIATIAAHAKDKGLSTTIVASDKDMLQLVDEDTLVFSPYEAKGVIYDARKVAERFGVEPQMIPDIIALMGDDVDNIPGIAGIGEKTAARLIKKFGSVEKLILNIEEVEQEKLRKAITENIEKIRLNRELAVLNTEVGLDFELDKFRIAKPDFKELVRLFKYLEFKSFLKGLNLAEDNTGADKEFISGGGELGDLLGGTDEIILCAKASEDIAGYAKGKFFRINDADEKIKSVLSATGIKKTGHDLKKIKILLARKNIVLNNLSFDTMVASYLLNPSKSGYALEDLAWDYLAKNISAENVSAQKGVNLILELKPKLEEGLREKSLLSLFNDVEMPLVGVLAEMELSGIKLDLKVLDQLSKDLEKRLIKLVEEIYELCGVQFNLNSPKQLRDILFERLKLPVIKRSKTGPSTDEEVLKALAPQHKLPALLLEYRQLTKLKTAYIDTLPGMVDPVTERVHASFNQTATETGRLSSSNPNLQNIPIKTDIGRNIRRAIISSGQDNYILSCDYSQIELRILAHISGDENLISAFKQDKDVHKACAALIYGLKEEEVNDPMRETAKRVNFGIVYGQSAYGLSRDLGISVVEAQSFIDAYFVRYPKVKDYIQEQIKKAKSDGFVSTILGRRRYIPEINNKNQSIRGFAERQAINTPIQGSASDLIKLAMIQIHNKIKEKRLQAKMIIQIHDELVFDAQAGELQEVTELVKERMENVLNLSVPLKVDIKAGKNWLEMKEVNPHT